VHKHPWSSFQQSLTYKKALGYTISAPYEEIATLMSSLLHAQVRVLKAALTCKDTSFRVLLNIHKMWVEGNLNVTSLFMVVKFKVGNSIGGIPMPKDELVIRIGYYKILVIVCIIH
jgi:hypothetical protein